MPLPALRCIELKIAPNHTSSKRSRSLGNSVLGGFLRADLAPAPWVGSFAPIPCRMLGSAGSFAPIAPVGAGWVGSFVSILPGHRRLRLPFWQDWVRLCDFSRSDRPPFRGSWVRSRDFGRSGLAPPGDRPEIVTAWYIASYHVDSTRIAVHDGCVHARTFA